MILEYILLLTLTVVFVVSIIFQGPFDAFTNAGPKLAARVEKNLMTGDLYPVSAQGGPLNWQEH
ncbi:MAG: hypothetical protein C5B49_14415 [Bdellovibrio sp.]|nr:MAG: hypothetical protein C5B49_14415 [Bdellovibrio sp.]